MVCKIGIYCSGVNKLSFFPKLKVHLYLAWFKKKQCILCYFKTANSSSGIVHPTPKLKMFVLLAVAPFFYADCFGVSWWVMENHRNIFLPSTTRELDGLWCSKRQKLHIWKIHHSNETVTRLLKIIHRHSCEQFHFGTVLFLSTYTCQPYHGASTCREETYGM